jgi:hypothetical protein
MTSDYIEAMQAMQAMQASGRIDDEQQLEASLNEI